MSVINEYTGSPAIDAILEAIDDASDAFHNSKQWGDQCGASSPAENIERLAKEAAAEIARLRALGLEACDLLSETTEGGLSVEAKHARATAERIRKELTR